MDRYKKIAVPIMLAALAAALIFGGWRHFRQGIYIADRFFYRINENLYRSNEDNRISRSEADGVIRFDCVFEGENSSALLERSGDNITLTYDDGTAVSGVWKNDRLLDGEGIPAAYSEGISVTFNDERMSIGKGALSDALCRIEFGDTEVRGYWGLPVIGVLIYALGVFGFLFPDKTHFFLRGWAYRVPELSEEGAAAQRIGGIVLMILGVLAITMPFL